MQKAYTKCQKSTNNNETCTQMQQTYETNDKNIKTWQKYVVIANAENIQQMSKKQSTNNKKTCTQKLTNIPNKWQTHQNMSKTQYVVITHAKSIQTMSNNQQTIVTHNKNATHIPNKWQKHQKWQKYML